MAFSRLEDVVSYVYMGSKFLKPNMFIEESTQSLISKEDKLSCQNTSFIRCDKNPWFCTIGRRINGLI